MVSLNTEELNKKLESRFCEGCWPFCDIEDGWADLVSELDDKISALDPGYTLAQVKEKYGSLRYYTLLIKSDVADTIFSLIDEYEEKSLHVCEICGEEGSLKEKNKWFKTLCDKHYDMWLRNKRW